MNCQKCEDLGYTLSDFYDGDRQVKMQNILGLTDFHKHMREASDLARRTNKYFIFECETRIQKMPKKFIKTRWTCSNGHEFYEEKHVLPKL